MNLSASEKALVARLLQVPAAGRGAALDRACLEEPALTARRPVILDAVVAGFAPEISPPLPMDEAAARTLAFALESPGNDTSGARIGPYKLLQKLGEGGFGTVWMAEQQEPIRRRVAVKIIKLGMDTEEVIARFEAERQALALMDHPNIARVFDAGATDTGRPYFVMELVRGVAITRYCNENRLSAEARLRLFIDVCGAVQHAHQKGVIHRDLKPSNILVTMHDGVAVPKVIDFGIAKATSGVQLTDKTLFTQFHAFIGTPAYTSPEQIEMSGLDVDTRSDIYSLGVLLYELLAGHPPFDADALMKSGLEAMRRTIREVDPPRPSTRLITLNKAERTSVAQQRGTEAGKLSLLLRGDLDWIVMRCLEKDRVRRYETASGLARDIQRHLENEPVTARPPTGAYRLRKFIRRHKIGVATATAIAVSIVAGLVVSSVLFVRERTAHARAVIAEHTQDQLRQQADAARQLEIKNANRTVLDLAGQLLERGQTGDGLAYLVYAAQKDPGNLLIAPRLASVLTSHNFLIPEGAPFQYGSPVLAVHYTADGRSIYFGTEDGTFRVIDAASGELKREIRLGKNVRREGWAFADKNEAVFGVSFVDKTIGLFEVKTGRPVWPLIPLDEELFLGSGAQFSPDGRWLYAHGNGLTCFWIWDTATGKELIKQSFAKYCWGPDLSKDGTRLAFVYNDKVNVWSLPGCKPLFAPIPINLTSSIPDQELLPHFSPDGRILAIADGQEGVHLFDPANGNSLQPTIRGEFNARHFAEFFPDGRLFAPSDKSWDLLDVTTGIATSRPLAPGFSNGGQYFSADGKFILTASDDGFPRVWEAETGRLVAEATLQQHDTFCAALSPDGTQAVLGTSGGAILRLRVGRGAARPLAVPSFHFAPDTDIRGVPLFGQEGATRLMRFLGDRAVVLDIASGREVAGGFAYPPADLPALQIPQTHVESRADRKFFVIQDWTGKRSSVVWENADAGFRRVGILQGDVGAAPGFGYYRSVFSPSGDLFARKNKGLGEIGVWDLHTGARFGPGCSYQDKLISPYQCLDFSPDGKRLAAGTMEGKVVVWDVATGRVITVLPMEPDTPCTNVQFGADGTRLLTTDGQARTRLWDAVTGEPCSALLNGAMHAHFAPDGRSLIMGDDSDIRINGTPLSELKRKPGMQMHFSRKGERIAIAEGDELQVYDVRTGQPFTESMRLNAPHPGEWSPDGRFLQIGGKDERGLDEIHYFLAVPPPLPAGTPIPPWLLQLAAICGAKKINEAGQCVDAPEVVTQIGDVRRQLAALGDDAPYVEWGRWMLDDSPTRSIAPGFTLTPAEADKLAAEGDQPTTNNAH